MPIPKYEKILLPLLEFAGDKNQHSLSEAYKYISDYFDLTEEERRKYLESGNEKILNNRVRWAKHYLKKAGLVESNKRGYFKITEKGANVLEENPKEIDNDYLRKFEDFKKWKEGSREGKEEKKESEEGKSPEEIMDNKYKEMKESLVNDIKSEIMNSSPSFFEELVVDLVIEMGYGGSRKETGEAIGGSGDEGIDGMIKEDRLGLDKIYIQAKRWKDNVGPRVVREFIGALDDKGGKKGILITTSDFSKNAKKLGKRNPEIVLIDGNRLADLMIENNLGVTINSSYKIKDIDTDYFSEE